MKFILLNDYIPIRNYFFLLSEDLRNTVKIQFPNYTILKHYIFITTGEI